MNCTLNCEGVMGSTGETDGDAERCKCRVGYSWDGGSLYCVKERYLTTVADPYTSKECS